MALDLKFILRDQLADPNTVDPVPEENPYVDQLDLKSILRNQGIIDNTAIDTMATGDTKKAAEINTVAKGLNEPIGMVADNFDEKKQQYDKQETAKVLQDAEHLRQFAADNQEVAPSVKPVLPALAKFETKLAKQEEALRQQRIENNEEFSFSDEPHAWTPDQEEPEDGWFRKVRANFAAGEYAGGLQSQVARAYEDDRTGKVPLTEAAKKEAEGKFEELAALEEVYGRNIPYSAGQIAGQMVDMPKSYLDEALSGAAQASAYGAGALAIAGLAGGVTGAVAMAPLAVMAGLGAVYSSTRAIEAGLTYKDMLDSGTPKEEAAVIAGTVGTINGLIEALGDMVLGAIGGKAAGLATKTFVRNALHQAVAKQSMGQAFKSVAKGYIGGISTEVTTEVFQEAVNIFGEEYAKRYNGGEAITLDEIRDRLTQIAITTFQGSLVLGAVGAGPVLTHQIHRVHAARNRQQVFSDLAADMKGNEAVQDAPEVVGAAVQHIADKSQASNVYIDGYAFAQTMEANKITIEDLRKVAPEIADQVETARRTGGDIVIPTGEYAVKIAPTDMGESLSMHVRTAEDQLSAAEAVQVDRVVKEQLRTAINDPELFEQQANEQLDGEYKEEAKKLEERYKAELEKHPRFKSAEARMQARYAATVATQMAKRAGIAPTELQNFAPTLGVVDVEENQVVKDQRSQTENASDQDQSFKQEPQEARAKLKQESEAWKSYVDGLKNKPSDPPIMLTQTPLVMKLLGANFKELLIAPHTFDGMFPKAKRKKAHHSHAPMTADVMKQLAEAIADPIMVFRSATQSESLVFVLDVRDAVGDPVIASVVFDAESGSQKAIINIATGAYGKDRPRWFKTQVKEGRLLYVNTIKIKHWNSHRVNPNEKTNASSEGQKPSPGPIPFVKLSDLLTRSVLTEADLVNLQKEYPGYYQTSATPTDPLVTIHNIRETGLLNVDKLGALPVPSLAVTKAGNEYNQYGEISLIGTKGMVDPSQTPVFSADAYTARFPKLNWTNSVDRPKAEALAKEVKEAQMRVGDSGTGPTYNLVDNPDRDQAVRALTDDVAGMVMFMNHKGLKFRVVRAKPKMNVNVTPEIYSYVESEQLTSENLEEGSAAHKRISDLAIERIKAYLENGNGPAAFRKRIHKVAMEAYEQTGFIPLAQAKSIVDYANQYTQEVKTYKKGKAPIDDWATKQALQKKIEPMQAEYRKFIADKVGAVFKAPRIQHGERTLPFNLANIVKVMTSRKSIRGAEEGALGGYGYGAIRASASKQYGSIEEMQADRDRVVDRDTSHASEQEVDAKLKAFMEAAGKYFRWGAGPGSYEAFEAAAEVLYKAAEKGGTAAAIRAAARTDFKALPPELVKQGVEALDAAKNVLTDYMEAKPQRAVQLSEFAGAVVPETIGDEARAVLENAGLKIQTYDPKQKGARLQATEELTQNLQAERGDVLFQLMGEKGAGRLSPAESQARLDALKVAKQMRLAGKDPKEIRLATGWERGTDGLWRFEFPDAQWKDGFFEDRYPDETTYMLSDLVDAPELFEAYPELRTYRISFSVKESDTLGSHNSGDKRIWINTIQFSGDPKADADVIRSTLLHEIQHAIQKQEGFVGGGNPRDSMMAYQKLLKEEVKPLYEMMRSPEWSLYQNLLRTGTIEEIAAAEKDPVVQNVFALQQKIRKKYSIDKNDKVIESVIDKPHSDNSVVWNWDEERYGYKIYERLGGEVESRNVEARMNMTDEQRRQTLLEETADVAPEDQIILGSPFLRPNTTRGTYAPGSNTISITLNGDLSTFAHEMGHWYLEQIFKYSKRPDVDPTIVEDAETIKKELGIPDDWDSLTFDAKRKYHEKFAYLTEIYLATGKAPTKSTESFFARMGAWIADVYRQFVGGIKQQRSEQYAREFGEQLPDISPELQRVFDRMVASQDMLKQAEAAESLRPLFETKPEDMDEATWIEMQSQRMVAEAEGAAKINEIHAKDEKWYTGARSKLLRKLQREAKEIRDKIRERIETQLRNQDVYIAIEIFKTGGKALGLENLKMDPDVLKDAGYTVTEIAKLRNLGCVRKGGLTPAQARELLRPFARFKTDKRMIRALINAKPINEAIEEATTEECLRKHSEMFDPVKLDAAVTAALHTEARERMIANELKYLAGTKGMNSRVLNEAARRAAEALVAGTKVGQATVKKYMALESKASRKAYEALAKGDRKAAAVAKHQQLLYSKCVREAMELEKDVAKLKRLKAKIFQSDKKIAKTRDTGILGVARYILTNHGLGKIRAADMDPATAMRYVDKLQKYDYEKFIAFKGLMERHGYKPNDPGLNALTVQELRALIGDVEFCWKASRDAKVIRLGDAAKTRDEVVTELLQQGQSLGLKEYAPGRGEKVTASERASHGLLSIAAQLRRVESWCNSMDAGNPDHPFRRYIYDPVAQACAKYRVANAAIQEKLANLVAARRKDWDRMTDIEAPEIGYVFRTKSELIGAILHTGNQSNKQKLLLGGRGDDKPWARLIEGPEGEVHVDTSAWDGFVQRCYTEGIITKEDMDFVQAVWDLMESEKPLIQKAFHQIYGFYFDEIPATEVQTPWGNYRGGYVPAMTDRYIVAEKGVQEEIERITENEYLSMMPVSRPGFAISRVAGYNKPLSLDIGQLCGHVEKTMRFAHIAPVVQEVAKIINDRDFTDFVNKINPHLISDLLAPWLKRAYNQRIDTGKADGLEKFLGAYRGLAAMGIMMGNVINAIQQTTGLSIAMSKVGAAKLAVANKKLILERGALIEKIETLSPFMKARLKDRSFEYESRVKRAATATGKVFSQRGLYNKAAAVYGKADPLRNWISSHAYLLQTAMQIPIDITVWVAAFDEAVAKGMSDQEAALEADSVVRTTQSSFAAEDIAKIETGGPIKRAFLVFYNYFGMQYNLLLERKAEANLKPWYKKYGTMAADFMLIVWIPAVLAKIFELALRGELGGDDEDEWEAIDWIQLIIGEPIKNVIAFAPIVGGMINSAGAMQT